jgi:23S rRNA (guanosine2251-2'-O)-methyltransferase
MSKDFIVGRKPVIEALNAGTSIEKIMILYGSHGEAIEIIRHRARQRNIPCTLLQKNEFDSFTNDASAQGVVALTIPKQYVEVEDILSLAGNEKPFVLIFDEIEDPQNLGALIRSAVCFGAHGGIIPKHHAVQINQTVAKTSAGASEYFPVAQATNIVNEIEKLKEKGLWVVGSDAKAEKIFTEIDYTMPVALVIGNEGKGIRRLVKEKCDFLVKIPMAGKFDSLNASVAGALMMYEVMRKRKGQK